MKQETTVMLLLENNYHKNMLVCWPCALVTSKLFRKTMMQPESYLENFEQKKFDGYEQLIQNYEKFFF